MTVLEDFVVEEIESLDRWAPKPGHKGRKWKARVRFIGALFFLLDLTNAERSKEAKKDSMTIPSTFWRDKRRDPDFMAQVRVLEERFAEFFVKRFIEKRIEVEESIESDRRRVFPWEYFVAAYNPRVILLIDRQYTQSGSHPFIRAELFHTLVTESLQVDTRRGPKKARIQTADAIRRIDAEVGQSRAFALKGVIDGCLSSLEKPMTQENVMLLRNALSSVKWVLQSMGVITQEDPKDTRGPAK